MKFFIDTADLNELRDLAATGLIDGVTTNPSLIARNGGDFLKRSGKSAGSCRATSAPRVTATDYRTMVREGRKLARVADNVVIKTPLTMDGLKACRTFRSENIKVNVTLCFSAGQAILAAKAGATYVSPFVGRLDDISTDGMQLIADIVGIYDNYPEIGTEVLVASIRNPMHLVEAARMGAHVATLPPSVLRQLFRHPLTETGLAAFLADWEKSGQAILSADAPAEKAG